MLQKSEDTIKVLVVDDSAFMRKVIADILNSDEKIEVIGTAVNGEEAIIKMLSLKPDLITLDVEMPVMDGLVCLQSIKKLSDTPVLMISSLTHEGAETTILALEYGAIDFITKPKNIFDMSSAEKKAELICKVKAIYELYNKNADDFNIKDPIKINSIKEKAETVVKCGRNASSASDIKKIVAIGISTGGPKSLREVIPFLPADLPAAVLLVQHMLPGFTKPLAERLNSISEIEVKEAEDNEVIKAGCVYLSPGDQHMKVKLNECNKLIVKLSSEPPVGGHRPSVDVMMESLSETGLSNIIAVIMTGMGGDGSKGIKKIKWVNKGYVIAQDEKSSIVFGMPKVAIETGAVDIVVPLKEIANEIIRMVEV
jgi:two-component system chemotaxis response regulator CheB